MPALRGGIQAGSDTPPPGHAERTHVAKLSNGLTAQFDNGRGQALYWPGLSKTSRLTLRNDGADVIRDILIELQGNGLSIDEVKSAGVRWRRNDSGWVAGLGSLAPGQSVPMTLGITLNPAAAALPARSEVVASLRVRGHGVAGQAIDDWMVADCALAFYKDLQSIRADFIPRLDRTVKHASSGDMTLPGRWMFRPSAASVPRKLRTTQAAANVAVAHRGRDPFYRRDGVKWLIGRLRGEMKRYFSQKPEQALCAPPGPMLENLQKQIDRLKSQADAMATYRRRAAKAVAGALSAAVMTMRSQRGGSPSALDDGLSAQDMAAEHGREQIAVLLRAMFTSPDVIARVRAAPDTIAALKIARQAMQEHRLMRPVSKWVKRRARSRRYVRVWVQSPAKRALSDALGAVERAAYLDMINAQHAGIYGAITDAIGQIRRASEKNCVCRY